MPQANPPGFDTHDITEGKPAPTPAELGWSPAPPPRPTGDPPDGPGYEWVLTVWPWPNPERPGQPPEQWYMWGWRERPTPADVARDKLLAELRNRRDALDLIRALPSVTSIKVPGLPITVASANDLDTIRRYLVVLSEILLDLMEVSAATVDEEQPPVGQPSPAPEP